MKFRRALGKSAQEGADPAHWQFVLDNKSTRVGMLGWHVKLGSVMWVVALTPGPYHRCGVT